MKYHGIGIIIDTTLPTGTMEVRTPTQTLRVINVGHPLDDATLERSTFARRNRLSEVQPVKPSKRS